MRETQILTELGKHDFRIEREFEANRSTVFRAFTEADLLCCLLQLPKGVQPTVRNQRNQR